MCHICRVFHWPTLSPVPDISTCGFYWNFIGDHGVRGDSPTAVSSRLGYALSGPLPVHQSYNSVSNFLNLAVSHDTDVKDLQRFWKVEDTGVTTKPLDQNIEGASRLRFHRASGNSAVHYIPHHLVRKDSSTTPIHIVYDCSYHESIDQPSINDCLLTGPPFLIGLVSIILCFRLKTYGVTTDIEKAFLHITLHPKDRDFTIFLWFSIASDPSSEFDTAQCCLAR